MLQKFLFVRHSFKLLPRLTISSPSRVEIIHRWSRPLYRVSSPAHTCACACGFVARYSRVERERERWRDTHRPRYCCLPITSDNGSISGSGAEIVPPSVTGMAHAATFGDVFERNAISAITKVEAGNWRDPLSVICTRYNGFRVFLVENLENFQDWV